MNLNEKTTSLYDATLKLAAVLRKQAAAQTHAHFTKPGDASELAKAEAALRIRETQAETLRQQVNLSVAATKSTK